MEDRHFEFEGREAKVDKYYNILLKVADVAADLELSQEILSKDACEQGGWILAGEVFCIATKKAKKATFLNWVSEYVLLERFIRSRMDCLDSPLADDGKPGASETQNEPSGNQDSMKALMNEFVQTAAHMGRLQRLAMEYRGILAELDHEFKGKRVIFGKLVEAIDRELAYGARWFPGTVGKPMGYPEAASLGKAVGQ